MAMKGIGAASSSGGGGGDEEGKEGQKGAGFIDFDAMGYADRSNQMLDEALRGAIPYYAFFNQKAIDEQRRQFDLGRNDIKEYFERSQAMLAPYKEAGYQALDTFQDTLGLARNSAGSSAMAKALENQAKVDSARANMRTAADQFLGTLNLSPEDYYRMSQGMTYANNMPGLMQGMSEFFTLNPGLEKAQMGVTQGQVPDPTTTLYPGQTLQNQIGYANFPNAMGMYANLPGALAQVGMSGNWNSFNSMLNAGIPGMGGMGGGMMGGGQQQRPGMNTPYGMLTGSNSPSIVGRTNPYGNLMTQAQSQFPSAYSSWLSSTIPQMEALNRAQNAMPAGTGAMLGALASGNFGKPSMVDIY